MRRVSSYRLPAILCLAGLVSLVGIWMERLDGVHTAIAHATRYELLWKRADGRIGLEADALVSAIRQAFYADQFWLTVSLLSGAAALVCLVLFQNRSLRRAGKLVAKNASDMSFMARHDALTRLPNRFAFDNEFRSALARRRRSEKIGILAIDLDGFKTINDMLGHGAGDALLVAVADILKQTVEDWDPRNLVARVGGDEFLALLWSAPGQPDPKPLADALMAILRRPLETTYGSMIIGATIGVAVSGSGSRPDEELMIDADLALTEAKGRGKDMVLEYAPHMRADLERRLRIEADLASAVENGQIVPHYQPQFDLATGRAVGIEALARWHHPELGWISPDEFIPIAESCGDVVGVGHRILHTACRDACLLPDTIGVSVNLSVIQILKDDIVASVKDVLEQTGLDPARLRLEVTESAMMMDLEKALATLNRLKALGVHIALDDFGSGFSALCYLTKFSWDELKIDRGFVASSLTDPVNMTIIRSVRVLARKIQARLTAEGIETLAQKEMLTRIGCNVGQGFLFSRPLPIEEIPALLLRSVSAGLPGPQTGTDRQPAPRPASAQKNQV